MQIVEFLVYVISVVVFTIYILFEKRRSYQKGFWDGVEHYSKMVDGVLHRVNRFNKEAEEAGMDFTAYVESIKPLNDAESEDIIYTVKEK